jgi:hypothetical protein
VRDGSFAAAHFPRSAGGGGGDLCTSWAYDADTGTWGINALRLPREE